MAAIRTVLLLTVTTYGLLTILLPNAYANAPPKTNHPCPINNFAYCAGWNAAVTAHSGGRIESFIKATTAGGNTTNGGGNMTAIGNLTKSGNMTAIGNLTKSGNMTAIGKTTNATVKSFINAPALPAPP